MLVVALFILGGAWWQRERIVDDMLRDQLAARNVEGDYTIERVGLRTQRFRDLVLVLHPAKHPRAGSGPSASRDLGG